MESFSIGTMFSLATSTGPAMRSRSMPPSKAFARRDPSAFAGLGRCRGERVGRLQPRRCGLTIRSRRNGATAGESGYAGRRPLADGAAISGSLYFGRLRTLSSYESQLTQDGRFVADIIAGRVNRVYSGRYTARASFNLTLQPEAFRRLYAEAGAASEASSFEAEKEIYVGALGDGYTEDLDAQRYYGRLLDESLRYRAVLEARVEALRRLSLEWMPGVRDGYGKARVGWFQEPVVDVGGGFLEARWRTFLDEEWRPPLKRVLEAHRARGQEKYMEAGDHMGRVLGSLLRMSYIYSKFVVYPLFGLPPHDNDWYEDAYEGGDLALEKRIFDRSFEELQKYRRLVVPKAPVGGDEEEL